MNERTYTVKELESLLHMSAWTIQKLIRNGKIQAMRTGKKYAVPESSLQAYLRDFNSNSNDRNTDTGMIPVWLSENDYEALKALFGTLQEKEWNPLERASINHLQHVLFPENE